ncbi:hypothetical protein QYF36_007330 [Acer negundo]|nr:hypothetical protein QYF36_007330 [Acer negundo]
MVLPENEVENIELLSSIEDAHGGVTVEMKKHMDSKKFASMLGSSLLYWIQQKKRGVWIKLPIEFSNLVEPAVKEGFRYHHAESDYLMLVKWIPETFDTLPANASHRVGIGAFVMNDKGEVSLFKLLGQMVLPDIVSVYRKIPGHLFMFWLFGREMEDSRVLMYGSFLPGPLMRVRIFVRPQSEKLKKRQEQSHQSFFRKSDLFFVCMLRPRSFEIQKQDFEIEAAQWMRVEDYAAQPFNQKNEIFKNMAGICLTKSKKDYTGFSTMSLTTSSGKRTYMYFNNKDFELPSLHKDAHEVNSDD